MLGSSKEPITSLKSNTPSKSSQHERVWCQSSAGNSKLNSGWSGAQGTVFAKNIWKQTWLSQIGMCFWHLLKNDHTDHCHWLGSKSEVSWKWKTRMKEMFSLLQVRPAQKWFLEKWIWMLFQNTLYFCPSHPSGQYHGVPLPMTQQAMAFLAKREHARAWAWPLQFGIDHCPPLLSQRQLELPRRTTSKAWKTQVRGSG